MIKFVFAFLLTVLCGAALAQSPVTNAQQEKQEPQTLNVRVEQAEPFRTAKEDKPALVAILTGPFGGGIAGAIAAGFGVLIAHLRAAWRQNDA